MPNSAFKSKTFRLLLAWFNIVFYTPIFGTRNSCFSHRHEFINDLVVPKVTLYLLILISIFEQYTC